MVDIGLEHPWPVRHVDFAEASPTSKAEVCSLKERVAFLERMVLKQQEGSRSTASANEDATTEDNGPLTDGGIPSPPNESSIASKQVEPQQEAPNVSAVQSVRSSPSLSSAQSGRTLLDHVLSTRGHWGSKHGGGYPRYFGSTRNLQIYSDLNGPDGSCDTPERPSSSQLTHDALRDLSTQTHDYLLELYWKYYNSVLHVVCRSAFLDDMGKKDQPGVHYSPFLHACLLAMGCRFANLDRPDVRRLFTGAGRETILHLQARQLLEQELDSAGGLTTVQALLILGDLMCASGHDERGWMYVGIACRQAFDLGLNADSTDLNLPERDNQIRHMVLWACVVFDNIPKYWALFLGRRPTIRTADLAQSVLDASPTPADSVPSLEIEVYRALLPLMGLAGKICENMERISGQYDIDSYMCMVALDRELESWHASLSDRLRWKPGNIEEAPASFFLLYQQYYTLLIFLHRPFAYQPPLTTDVSGLGNFVTVSRKRCFENAIRVARIFRYHNTHFNGRQIFITGLDHASAAAAALIGGIVYTNDRDEKLEAIKHLDWLIEALEMTGPTHFMANKVVDVLQALKRENGWDEFVGAGDGDLPTYPSINPSMRGLLDTNEQDFPRPSPKRRIVSPTAVREAPTLFQHENHTGAAPAISRPDIMAGGWCRDDWSQLPSTSPLLYDPLFMPLEGESTPMFDLSTGTAMGTINSFKLPDIPLYGQQFSIGDMSTPVRESNDLAGGDLVIDSQQRLSRKRSSFHSQTPGHWMKAL
ncbi:hypothetical protein N7451_003096 [Penicillium sp. IBT 35674x]|nr:hypothetical protein N7451_003096 [Penicillium sp. IBT 35674x]